MCDPTLFMIAQGAGTALSAFGASQQSAAAKGAAQYNAAVSRNQAEDALSRGAEDVVQIRMRASQIKGSQAAAMAANNVALDEQSALDVLATTDILSEMDQQTVLRNAEREAAGLRQRGTLYDYEADSESPLLAGIGPLLTGGARVAEKWYQYKQVS